MMSAIGGYFSLELPKGEEFHSAAIKLNTGRNSLEYILRNRHYKKVHIPYYTCDSILEPFQKLNIPYKFYHINNKLELCESISLLPDEAILYTNYFGLKQEYVKTLATNYGTRLIVDNTQAFYSLPEPHIDTFYSCRKYFGVPDGAYLYTEEIADFDIRIDHSHDRMDSLLKRIDLSPQEGFEDFHETSRRLSHQPIKQMSKLTERLMRSVNYKEAAERRINNYRFLHHHLLYSNRIQLNLPTGSTPMIYPFLTQQEGLRSHLISKEIFVARYWPNVTEWCDKQQWEHTLSTCLLPLPIDQRYDESDMEVVISTINEYLK